MKTVAVFAMVSAASAAGASTLACTVANMGSMAIPQAAILAVVFVLIVVFIMSLVKSSDLVGIHWSDYRQIEGLQVEKSILMDFIRLP